MREKENTWNGPPNFPFHMNNSMEHISQYVSISLWCTRVVRGTHGCGLWKSIRKDADNFFGHVVYAVVEGNRFGFGMTLGVVLFL